MSALKSRLNRGEPYTLLQPLQVITIAGTGTVTPGFVRRVNSLKKIEMNIKYIVHT